MCIYMYIFRTCSSDSYCASHFRFGVILYAFVAIIVLQVGHCVLRWHVRFVTCIVVCVLCMYLCRLKVLATHTLFVSFYVGFGVLLAQLAVWQLCGVRYCVGALCFVLLRVVIATAICIWFYRCEVACFLSSQTVLDVNSYPGICAMDAFAL